MPTWSKSFIIVKLVDLLLDYPDLQIILVQILYVDQIVHRTESQHKWSKIIMQTYETQDWLKLLRFQQTKVYLLNNLSIVQA